MKVDLEDHNKKKAMLAGMERGRTPFWQHWRDCADYILPQRYVWLSTTAEQRISRRNSMILDSTGTKAARTLASGMMNGITSPARPWFKLRIAGNAEYFPAVAEWTEEVERRMLRVMAESNFYNSMAVLYLDLVVFGTACSLIYESDEKTIHCYNPALGEYYLGQDPEHRVNQIAREFQYTTLQMVAYFGEENVSDTVKRAYQAGGAQWMDMHTVVHLIQPNIKGPSRYEECYWEKSGPAGFMLKKGIYNDFPAITPRWELAANDVYGTSPAMDALPDIIQLQHETKKKAQALDKMVAPPILADIQLKGQPTALLPNGITYVPRLTDTSGARPIYTVNPPLGEMSQDIAMVQGRIRETFHNELFQMISQLETVRSATEIDARREEKLVLLGPVLERFENEALDPAIERIFGIMDRKGLLPEPPPELLESGAELEIQYVSILSAAQSAVGTAPIERLLQIIGNIAPIWPEAKMIPDIPELLHDYAIDIGVKQKNLRPTEVVNASIQQQNQKEQTQEQLTQATVGAQAGKLLSETDVGGGANALQRILGSVTA
jgi:hypothetical protein